ncbi:MAG: hypothetical protein PHI18_01440 [bacterium]|nr:hypothetical protein [bacterium]
MRGFVLGECPACGYDNWTSHISEGIAREGYNDYGPAWLDPQASGFGSFTLIPNGPAGDATLTGWRAVFAAAVDGEWNAVDSILIANEPGWHYELAELADTSIGATFFVVRESLDSSFVDVNTDTSQTDDVIGSFAKGWGLFVFNPTPACPKLLIEMPHPEDDFISIPVGLELFIQAGARAMLIAGAGREVLWNTQWPPYDNSKSLSDPTRNNRCPFQAAHETLFDLLDGGPADPLLTVQMHSYDTGAHGSLKDLQISAFRDDQFPNPPLRDLAGHIDLIHALGLDPVNGLTEDETIHRRVDDYAGLWSQPAYKFFGPDDTLDIASIYDLLGAAGNQQAEYSHDDHDVYADPENFIHIEIDEYPDALWNPTDWPRWLAGPLPPTTETYALAVEYYQPLISALDSVIRYYQVNTDTLPPATVTLYQATRLTDSEVYLRWTPEAADPNFDTYMLYYDTVEISDESPFATRMQSYLSDLYDFHKTGSILRDLTAPPESYFFAVGSRDAYGNTASRSNTLSVTDGPVDSLTVLVVSPDTLELNWESLPGDSLYRVSRLLSYDTAFVFWMNSDSNWLRIPVAADSQAIYRISRVIRE